MYCSIDLFTLCPTDLQKAYRHQLSWVIALVFSTKRLTQIIMFKQ
jgi:hypothetical protein